MKRQSIIGLSGLAVAAVAASAGVAAASSGHASHTITFTAHGLMDKSLGAWNITDDKDTHNGRYVGNDLVSGSYDRTAKAYTGTFVVALKGGNLSASISVDAKSGIGKGRITGGTGRYDGATGTFTASPGGKTETITMTYRN